MKCSVTRADVQTVRYSAESAAQRLVLVAVPVWLIGQLLTFDSARSLWPAEAVVASALISASGYAWFAVQKPRKPWPLLAALWVATLVLAILGPTGSITPGSYPPVVAWQSLAAICTGALLPSRRGALTLAALICTVATILYLDHPALAHAPEAVIRMAASSLAGGLALVAAMSALRGTAQRSDDQARTWAAAESTRVQVESEEAEQRRVVRLLHDTVVNTLGAVARLPQNPETVAKRCRADLELLERVEAHDGDPRAVLNSARVRARLLGVNLRVEVDRLGPQLPPRMADAINGALWEALNNVAKHSGTDAAELRWRWDGLRGSASLADLGRGFHAESGWEGGGQVSVADRCAEAGVAASLTSATGQGTTVHLTWHGEPPQVFPPQLHLPELHEVTSRVVLGVGLIFAAIGTFLTIVVPAGGRRVSLALIAVIMLVVWHSDRVRRGDAFRVWGVTYPSLIGLVAVLHVTEDAGCPAFDLWWWGPQAALVVTVAAILLDGRAWVVLATAAAYLLADAVALTAGHADSCPGGSLSLVAVDLAVIVAVIAFRNRLTGTWEIGQQAWAAIASEQQRTAAARGVAAVRSRLLDFACQVAEPVLEGLATGQLAAADSAVRSLAGRAEATLRALATIPHGSSPAVYDALVGFVAEAHQRGITLRLNLPGGLAAHTDAALLGNLLLQLLAAAPPGSMVQVTILPGDEGDQILGVVENSEAMGELGHAGQGWRISTAGSQALLEALVPA